jgi:hypothetical protein
MELSSNSVEQQSAYRAISDLTDQLFKHQPEAFITIRLPTDLPPDEARQYINKHVFGPLEKFLVCRFGAVGIIRPTSGTGTDIRKIHYHGVLRSADGWLSDPEVIPAACNYMLNRQYPNNTADNAVLLESPDNVYGACRYTAKHLYDHDLSQLITWNKHLLHKEPNQHGPEKMHQ